MDAVPLSIEKKLPEPLMNTLFLEWKQRKKIARKKSYITHFKATNGFERIYNHATWDAKHFMETITTAVVRFKEKMIQDISKSSFYFFSFHETAICIL